jgi:glycosyltransferase involved in cell wall biosynthesis
MTSKTSTAPDVSVVLTAHSEGRLTHGSAKSALRAARHARANGIGVELIAVVDSPSPGTLAYFEEWGGMFGTVAAAEVGDSGLARNHGAGLASGRYVAFLNPGDLFSENWLTAAFGLARGSGDDRLVLHPELNLFFGEGEVYLAESLDSDAADYSPLELIEFDPWTPLSFVSRAFFLGDNLYAPVRGSGFGRQHWHWDCEAVANRAVHRLVPGTVHFVRLSRRGAGDLEETFRPTRLFDISTSVAEASHSRLGASVSRLPAPGAADPSPAGSGATAPDKSSARAREKASALASSLKGRARDAALRLLRPRPDLLQLCVEFNWAVKKFRAPRVDPLSERGWLLREWSRIQEVEPGLFPSRAALETLERRTAPRSAVAYRYPEMYKVVGPSPTHLFLLPWVKRGGSDVEAILYVTAVLRESPGSEVTCVTTEEMESEWLSRLPEGVRVVEYGRALRGFSEKEKAALLLRLLVQKNPAVIHNINSALGYRLFVEHGPALASRSRLFATIFGFEFMDDGSLGGYPVSHLPYCVDYLSGVFTDSQYFADRLCDTFGYQRNLFSVVYVPAPPGAPPRPRSPRGRLDVLWASRFDVEKRLDVLIRVASELVGSNVHLHVYGGPVMRSAPADIIAELRQLPNVTAYGAYDKFESIPAGDYDAFLYTSERDGLPNVLLEAVAAGLPVIAPDVGGIKELINDETGFLVSGPEAVGEYVEYIKGIERDYRVVAPKVAAARALIESRHSWQSFVAKLRQAPGYLRPRAERSGSARAADDEAGGAEFARVEGPGAGRKIL